MTQGHDIAIALRGAYLALHRRSESAFAPHGVTADQFVVIIGEKGFFRTLGDGVSAFPASRSTDTSRVYDLAHTRARSNAKPACPYIARLMNLSRFTCPSTGPLLHDVDNAA